MNITVIGTGFVGVVTAAVYASFGHQVIGLDIDEQKIASLKKAKVPFYEPGLEELLQQQLAANQLNFPTNHETAIKNAQLIIYLISSGIFLLILYKVLKKTGN